MPEALALNSLLSYLSMSGFIQATSGHVPVFCLPYSLSTSIHALEKDAETMKQQSTHKL